MHKLLWYPVLLAFLCIVTGPAGTAHAQSSYLTSFNSTYPSAPAAIKACVICHPNYPSSTARNSYGSAYGSAGNFGTIETADSDGDGFTNIAEINAGTFPGNAASKPVTAVQLTSIAISGPAAVNEGATATYTATATMSDGSTKPVTPTWTENSAATKINKAGLLTALPVATDQAVTITASYTQGARTRTATTNVTVLDVPPVASVTINAPVAGTLGINALKLDYLATGSGATVYLDGQATSLVTGNTLSGLSNGSHTVRVDATDTLGGAATAEVTFTVAVEPIAFADLTKKLTKGTSSVACLLLDYATGNYVAKIVNSKTRATLNSVDFGAANTPVALASTPDLDGSGKLELAMLAKDSGGNPVVVIKDSVTGADVKTIALPEIVAPIALASAGDTDGNGNPEIAVLGTSAGGDPVVVLYDLVSATLAGTIPGPAGMLAKSLAVVGDVDGNSVPELAVLGVLAGQGQYVLLDAATGDPARTKLLPTTFNPTALAAVADTSGNGADELAVLGVYLNGKVKAIVVDSSTGKNVGILAYPAKFIPQGLAVINDTNGNAAPEIGALGLNAAGAVKATFGDLSSKTQSGIVNFPSRQM